MPVSLRNVLVLLIAAALGLLTLLHARGPAPRTAAAPPGQFSAVRARDILRDLAGDGVPHPLGTAAHEAVRLKIVQRLRALGYQVSEETSFSCSKYGVCATVRNIVAVGPSASSGNLVALAAHYDSVPAGPGVCDDGGGTGPLLEIARIMAGEKHRNGVLFLLDDGEEAGLLGAEAFMARSLWASRVVAFINVDNRGTSGQSYMFETSPGNGRLIEAMAGSLSRPVTTSLFYEVYKRLPNDTDFTVFKRYGKAGVNFGFIGDPAHYHTPLDDLGHASLRSLQHNGDNALEMARALADLDPATFKAPDVVWFDLLSAAVIRWPGGWTMPLAGLAFLLSIAACFVGHRAPREVFWGLLFFLTSILGAVLVSALVAWLLGMRHGAAAPWIAHPAAAIAAAWVIGLLVPLAMVRVLGRRAGSDGLILGPALGWSVLGIAVGAAVPGASYLFIPVALMLSVMALARMGRFDGVAALMLLAATALSAALLFPLALSFYDALGVPLLPVTSLLLALTVTVWCGSTGVRRGVVPSLAVAGVLLLTAALVLPTYSIQSPQGLNLFYQMDADSGRTRFLADVPERDLPSALRTSAEWKPKAADLLPWWPPGAVETSAPPGKVVAPTLEVLSDQRPAGGPLRLRIHSPRGANVVALNVHDGGRLKAARATEWIGPFELRPRPDRWSRFSTRDGGDLELELSLTGTAPLEVVVEDQTFGLPPSAAPLARARGTLAVPNNSGDRTIVTRKMSL